MIAALYVQADSFHNRFFAKIKRDENTGCLIWTASKNKKGYGQIGIGRIRPVLAHRAAWAMVHGAWPSDCVLHTCDNPACVEITHLREGSRADNNAEMRQKGRERKVGSPGERNGSAKLSPEAVFSIRSSTASCRAVAKQFGISFSLVSQVRRRLVWGHV